MALQSTISDSSIMSMLQQHNSKQGWDFLYDKYAAILYGAILRAISDKKVAEKILLESFISLQETNLSRQTHQPVLSFLLQHIYRICKQNLSAGEINRMEEELKKSEHPLLNLFLFTPHSMQHITSETGLSEVEIKRKLRSEATELIQKSNTEKKIRWVAYKTADFFSNSFHTLIITS